MSRPTGSRALAVMLAVAVGLVATPSLAEDEPPPVPPPATPPVPTHPIPRKPPPLPPDPLTATPLDRGLLAPPQQPLPVPDPSPVVLGGVPAKPGEAGVPLRWKRRRFSVPDAVIMLGGGAVTLATAIVRPLSGHARGPILFDEEARDALRAPTEQLRYTYRDISDVGLSLATTWPLFVDALITAWWLRGSRDVAQQMALVSLETLAVSAAVQGVTNTLVSRERPYGPNCGGALPENAIDCTSSSHFRSFFSGHSSFSFTAAALVCFNHFDLELLGRPWDAISCAGAYGVAGTTALFRVVSDVHYASDVITGALVGSVIGYGVPLLHTRQSSAGTITTGAMKLRIVPSGVGAGLVGIF